MVIMLPNYPMDLVLLPHQPVRLLPRWPMNHAIITACSFTLRLCIPRMVPIYWPDLRLAFVAVRDAGQLRTDRLMDQHRRN